MRSKYKTYSILEVVLLVFWISGCDAELHDSSDAAEAKTRPASLPLALSFMDMVADKIFTGEPNTTSRLGQSVVLGKDINGDGYGDMFIGAPYYRNIQGRVYIYYGGKDATFDVPDLTLTGEGDNNYFGHDIEVADFNNDGYADMATTALGYNSFQGRAYLYYGGPDFDAIADKVFNGEPGTTGRFGREIAAADINNDGCAELLVCADRLNSSRGRVYLFYGAPDTDMDTVYDLTFDGENKNDRFGLRMTAGGDVNGDNYDDVIIGAEYAPDGNAKGKAYLFYGAPGISMDRNPDKIFVGEANRDRFGNSQLLVDIDRDGFADVLIGAPGWNRAQGRTYLYWGDTEANMDVNADAMFTGEGGALGDYIVCGYFNNDDYLDIVVGAGNYNENRGKVYIFNGGRRVDIDEICDTNFIGINKGSRFGNMLASGDFNGDNYDDLAVGGRTYNNFQGRVWLYYGVPKK
jgi:hypothetical protein